VVRGLLPVIVTSRNPQSLRLPVEGTSSGLAPTRPLAPSGRNDMHREDVMKPDLLSEIVLLGSGSLLFVSLLLIVATALTRT
jgi:hypothetical protein